MAFVYITWLHKDMIIKLYYFTAKQKTAFDSKTFILNDTQC